MSVCVCIHLQNIDLKRYKTPRCALIALYSHWMVYSHFCTNQRRRKHEIMLVGLSPQVHFQNIFWRVLYILSIIISLLAIDLCQKCIKVCCYFP